MDIQGGVVSLIVMGIGASIGNQFSLESRVSAQEAKLEQGGKNITIQLTRIEEHLKAINKDVNTMKTEGAVRQSLLESLSDDIEDIKKDSK